MTSDAPSAPMAVVAVAASAGLVPYPLQGAGASSCLVQAGSGPEVGGRRRATPA
jgi:hypothetical protein